MTLPSKHKWLSLTILAIIIPTGLLTAFKLTGIISAPLAIAEIITAKAVTWKIERPSTAISFVDMKVRNNYSDDAVSVNLDVYMATYFENDELFGDHLKFGVNVTATVQQGFIYSLLFRFSRTDEKALLLVSEDTEWRTLENLKITDLSTEATYSREAQIYATSVNNPKKCTLKNPAYWYFLDVNENDQDHWTNVTLETTYFNGTAYRKVLTPIQIGIMHDAGNGIDDANIIDIGPGTYTAFVGEGIPFPGFDDVCDYYKIFVEKGYMLNVTMKPPNNTDFNLYLYDPIKEGIVSSENSTRGALESIQYAMSSAGYWYIQVKAVDGCGIYTLEIS